MMRTGTLLLLGWLSATACATPAPTAADKTPISKTGASATTATNSAAAKTPVRPVAKPAMAPEQQIAGDWVISRELAAGNAATLTPDEVESLLGAQAHYDSQSAAFAGVDCGRPSFDSYRETSANLYQLFELRFDDLAIIGDDVLAIDINCMDADVEFLAGNTVLVAGPDRLVTVVEGVWFELKRR